MAITYVNDLRLSEMATGDNSGTWGNVTNTNLELIGDAFGHGTRAIANASTDNITIADGTADADRAMYLKLTGGGQACEITLLPNTVSKVWMMENGTAAALTFTQGSGASVIIPAGDTKIIASDGGGSGAIVYDVFASLSVVDLKVQDDLTVTDDVAIGGLATVGGTLTATKLVSANGVLELDDDGSHNGVVNSPASLFLNIDSDNGATNEKFQVAKDRTSTSGGTALFTVNEDGSAAFSGVVTANAGVVVDEMTLDADTLTATDTFTIDAVDDITLNSDNSGRILFGDASVIYGIASNSSSDFVLEVGTSDKAILFKGQDGGASITALTLDMSNAGRATFNDDVLIPRYLEHVGDSDTFLGFGGANDFEIVVGASASVNINATDTIFNEASADRDFRVESDNKTHMFFVDSGSDYIAMGTGDQNNGGLLNLNAVSGSTVLTMTTRSATDAHTNIFSMQKTPATSGNYTATASGDILGDIRFYGVNTSTVADIGARIQVEQTGTASGTVPAKMIFMTNESTAMTINSSQEVGINTAPISTVTTAIQADSSNHPLLIKSVSSGHATAIVDNTAGGDFMSFRVDNSERGRIRVSGNDFAIAATVNNIAGLYFAHTKVLPLRANALVDNQVDLGSGSYRWQVVYAGTGTINTSDENEKQNIAALTSAEMLVAKRISTLFKTFRFKDSVTDKGENARTHSGIIAQDVKAAFEAEGLNAANYGLWCSDTWWEHDVDVAAIEADDTADLPIEAVEAYTRTDVYQTEDEAPSGSTKKTRLGIRYPELLSFLAAYNEQRFAAIETRLTALEG